MSLKSLAQKKIISEYVHVDAKLKKNLFPLPEAIQPGDLIIMPEVILLSRSTKQLCKIIDVICEKYLCLAIAGSITLDCRSEQIAPMREAFTKMASVFSKLELQMMRNRVKSGMANAKAKDKQVGRQPTTKDDIPAFFYKHSPSYAAKKMNVGEPARICKLSRPTVYKYFKLFT